MDEADRIARETLEADQRRVAEASEAATVRERTKAAEDLKRIRSLSREALVLLEASGYRDPAPEPLTLSVERVPLFGDLFGHREVVKGGWKIAEWRFHPEKGPHRVWLLADERYCWNRRMVSISEFVGWHGNQPVEQGPARMIEGLEELKKSALRTA